MALINSYEPFKPSSKMWTGMRDINSQYNFKNVYGESDFEPYDDEYVPEESVSGNANPVAYQKPSNAKSGGGGHGNTTGPPGAGGAWANGPVVPWNMKFETMEKDWDAMEEGQRGAQHIDDRLRMKYIGEVRAIIRKAVRRALR